MDLLLEQGDVNYWAVLVAAAVSMAIGAVWYNVFSKPWLAGVGLTTKQMSLGGLRPYLISFVAELVIVCTIAHFFFYVDGANAGDGMAAAFWLWLGIAATVTAINYAYQHKSLKLYAIDAGYTLVFFLASGAIIGAWLP